MHGVRLIEHVQKSLSRNIQHLQCAVFFLPGGGQGQEVDGCNEFDIMMNVYKEKKHREHLKKFNKGMTFFDNGYDRPRHDLSEQLGWDAAQEMKAVKVKYLNLMEQAYNEKLQG